VRALDDGHRWGFLTPVPGHHDQDNRGNDGQYHNHYPEPSLVTTDVLASDVTKSMEGGGLAVVAHILGEPFSDMAKAMLWLDGVL